MSASRRPRLCWFIIKHFLLMSGWPSSQPSCQFCRKFAERPLEWLVAIECNVGGHLNWKVPSETLFLGWEQRWHFTAMSDPDCYLLLWICPGWFPLPWCWLLRALLSSCWGQIHLNQQVDSTCYVHWIGLWCCGLYPLERETHLCKTWPAFSRCPRTFNVWVRTVWGITWKEMKTSPMSPSR